MKTRVMIKTALGMTLRKTQTLKGLTVTEVTHEVDGAGCEIRTVRAFPARTYANSAEAEAAFDKLGALAERFGFTA